MKTIFVDVEVQVMVPVRAKAQLVIQAENKASITKAIKHFSCGQPYDKADLETILALEITEVGPYDGDEPLDSAVRDIIESEGFTVLTAKVDA